MTLATNLNLALSAAQEVAQRPLDLIDSLGNKPMFGYPLSMQATEVAYLGPLTADLAETALPTDTPARRGVVKLDTYVVKRIGDKGVRYLFVYVASTQAYVAGFDRSFGSDPTLTKIRMQAVRQRLVRIDAASAVLAISRVVEAGHPMTKAMAEAMTYFTDKLRSSPLAVLAIASTAPDVYGQDVVAQAASQAREQFRGRPSSFVTTIRVLDTLMEVGGVTFVKAHTRKIRELIWGSSQVESQVDSE